MDTLSVLLVDDEPDVCELLKRKLARESPDLAIRTAYSARECLDIVRDEKIDCILADYQMPGMDGLELLNAIRELGLDIPFIFVTGQGSEDVARQAFRNGADDYFTKEVTGFAFATRMANSIKQSVYRRKWTADILRKTAEGVNFGSGGEFFDSLTRFMATTLQVDIAFIGELREDFGAKIDTVSVFAQGNYVPNFSYSLMGTPCETVVDNRPCIYPKNVQRLFPEDEMLVEMGLESYAGVPLYDSSGRPIGLLVVVHSAPLMNDDLVRALMLILADGASAELEAARAARRHLGNQAVQATLDASLQPMAIIKPGLSVYMVNRAAVKEGSTAGIGSPDCHKALHNLDSPCGPGGSLPCAVAQAFSTGIKHKAVQRHIWPDGREGSVEVIATPLFGYKGDIIGVLETFGTS